MIDKVTFFVRKHEYASHHFPSTCVLREFDKRVCSENKGMRGIFNDRQREIVWSATAPRIPLLCRSIH